MIKIEEDLKASVDIFTVDPIKYKISEKLKKSFDPKRILNPGKMYRNIMQTGFTDKQLQRQR